MARIEFKVKTAPDTYVPLVLETAREDKEYICTLTGDAGTKDLYRGASQVTQQRVWRETTKHYKARAEAEGWTWPNGV